MSQAMQGNPTDILSPGATLGVFGSGQLGRMFVHAAQRMGYRVHVFSTQAGSPAGSAADHEHVGEFTDLASVEVFAKQVDAATLEFENVPTASLEAAARHTIVRPGAGVLHQTQHRVREKTFLQQAGAPVGEFAAVSSHAELSDAVERLGLPAVLKTAQLGYDGKGQRLIRAPEEIDVAWAEIGSGECILEAFIEFAREVSVLVARGADGAMVVYGPIENHHENHILDLSFLPAPSTHPGVPTDAANIGRLVAEKLDLVGLICVELFEKPDGQLLVNEIAPRPHNSGHLTIEGCHTSQFEQQVRALCGFPLGSSASIQPSAMANLLGDLWTEGEPNWSAALEQGAKLHLYGKESPKPGRKMGHLTAWGKSIDEARATVLAARQALTNHS